MKILFLHDYDFRTVTGGAELNLRYAYNEPPEDVEVSFLNNKLFTRRRIKGYDKIVIGNSRTMSISAVKMMVKILKEEKIPYIKSEHDVMWSDDRSGKELKFYTANDCRVVGDATKNEWYEPTKQLFEGAEAVRYLSPKQRTIFETVGIKNPNWFIAGSYVDTYVFKNIVEWEKRPYGAFVKGGKFWGEDEGKRRAEADGIDVHVMAHRGLDPEGMAKFFNNYKYFYDYPEMMTTYGRAIIEAYLCGVKLVVDPCHAIYSFGTLTDAIDSSWTAIEDFWEGVLG